MMQGVTYEQDFPLRPLFRIAFPVFVESFLRILLGNVDQWMLSDFSDQAVAAVGNANQVLNMSFVALDMVGTATTIILAQYIGAKREKDVRELYTLSLSIISVISLAGALFLVVFRHQIFLWMNIPPELMEDAGVYLLIVGGTLLFQGLLTGVSAIMRSHVMMREVMVVSILMNVINVLINFLLINGYGPFPRLGVAGAAIATAASRAVGAGVLLFTMSQRLDAHIELDIIRHPNKSAVFQLFRVGLPAAGDTISYNTMQIVLLSVINTFGTVAVTSKVYVGTVLPFVYIFSSSIATATQILVGQFVGAHKPQAAQKLVFKSATVSVCISFVLTLGLYLCCDQVFGIFTKNPEILQMIRQVIFVELFLELGRAINMTMIRSLLSAGDTTYPLYCALLSQWGVGVFLGYMFGVQLGTGLVGIWVGMALDEWCRAAAFVMRWKGGRWKTKQLV